MSQTKTMPPVRLSTGRYITFHWNEPDQGFIPSDNGCDMTDAEWLEYKRILESRRPIESGAR